MKKPIESVGDVRLRYWLMTRRHGWPIGCSSPATTAVPICKPWQVRSGPTSIIPMLQKIYRATVEGQERYSPAECIGAQTNVIEGNPDPKHISASFVERANLTLRSHNRRFARLTNAFAKKFLSHVPHGGAQYGLIQLSTNSQDVAHNTSDDGHDHRQAHGL